MSEADALKKLKAKWENILKESGFEDIERPGGRLKNEARNHYEKAIKAGRQDALRAREEYYRSAGHFLWDHKFDSPLERRIWEMHAIGTSHKDIARILSLRRMGHDTIRNIIVKLAGIMRGKCLS